MSLELGYIHARLNELDIERKDLCMTMNQCEERTPSWYCIKNRVDAIDAWKKKYLSRKVPDDVFSSNILSEIG